MTRHAVLPLADGRSTLTLAHINDTHGRYLPVAVSPGNATAQTGDPGRKEESFSRVAKVGGYAVLAAALRQVRVARWRRKRAAS